MSFNFVIPISKEELLVSGVNQYVVEDVCSIRELPNVMEDCRLAFENQGSDAVLEKFDIYYSVLSHFNDIESHLKQDMWDLVLKGISSLRQKLTSLLDDTSFSKIEKHHYLNILKMSVYLLCQYTEHLENDATKPSISVLITGKSKGYGNKKKNQETWNWDFNREEAVTSMNQLLHLPLNKLWDPPIVEQEFVNLITGCCYKLLENPEVPKIKSIKELIFHTLATCIKKYNHSLGCSLKVMQLLQHFEHLVTPLVQAVELFSVDYNATSIINEIIREIGRMDSQDLSKDSSGTRSISAFLMELAERVPTILLTNISILLTFLDEESYVMRNCVLTIIKDIVLKLLSLDDLDIKARSTRDKLLDKLEDHIHDVNAFVRTKSLQIWLQLCQESAIPLPRQKVVLEYTIGRLEDKSCNVRKAALQLMTGFLKSNPFAAKLSLEELKCNYEKELVKLNELMSQQSQEHLSFIQELFDPDELWKAMIPELKMTIEMFFNEETEEEFDKNLLDTNDSEESVIKKIYEFLNDGKLRSAVHLITLAKDNWPESERLKFEDADVSIEDENDSRNHDDENSSKISNMMQLLKSIFFNFKGSKSKLLDNSVESSENSELEEKFTTENIPEILNEVSKQQVLVQYLEDTVAFASLIQVAVPVIALLLGSNTLTDVLEAIDFFVTATEFGVSNAVAGIRRMLVLIWSKEAKIKDAVVAAYKRLYITTAKGNSRFKAQQIINNLSTLISGATLGELTSLEELICEFIHCGEIGQNVIQLLWERFSMKIEDTTIHESNQALVLLGMAASADVDIVRSNINILIQNGLNSQNCENFYLVRDTCMVLLKLVSNNKVKPDDVEEPFRFPENHEMFEHISHIIVSGINRIEDNFWIPMAEQAINVIYKLAEHPEILCGNIVKKLVDCMITWNQNNIVTVENQADFTMLGNLEQMDKNQILMVPTTLLKRLLAFTGHVALRQLLHLEVSIFNELKRRRALIEKKSGNRRKYSIATENSKIINQIQENLSEIVEDEMGLGGTAVEDDEAEFIRTVCEEEIVSGNNLLAVLRPLLISICSNPAKYSDPELQCAASLALTKCMLVSSEFCEEYLQLLVTILEKSAHSVIRSNTIIALGDLAFRFPNLIEPWTSHLFARLNDECSNVRKNTLKVLSHLILNDMVKVKGHISEMANCIMDSDDYNAKFTKLFFLELSKKGNAIYNLMPDIISRLSDPDVGVSAEHFRVIMKYLFSFIQKEKQCESLVEKLCQRFRMTRTDQQWRDLAFCLSMLSYGDHSINKLQENFICYADKLSDNEVFDYFTTILNGATKCAKPELKTTIEELFHRIEECHTKGLTEEEIAEKAKSSSVTAKERKIAATPRNKNNKKGKIAKKKPCSSDSDEDLPTKATRSSTRFIEKKKPSLAFSSDEDFLDEKDTSDVENDNPNIVKTSGVFFKKPRSQAPRTRKSIKT